MRTLLMLVAFAPALVACTDIALQDDLAPRFGDSSASQGAEGIDGDGLHTPYAVGTRVRIRAARDDGASGSLRVESRSPSVLTAVDRNPEGTEFIAVHAGQAELAVVEGSETVHVERIEVLEPDAATLHLAAAAPLDLGAAAPLDRGAAALDVFSVTLDTPQTFELRYSAAGQRLYGRGAGTLEADEGLQLARLDGSDESYSATASAPGLYRLVLRRGAATLGEWRVDAH